MLALLVESHCTVRDVSLKKRDSSTFLGHLSFWVSGMESSLIFLYTKKIRKNTNYKIHDMNSSIH